MMRCRHLHTDRFVLHLVSYGMLVCGFTDFTKAVCIYLPELSMYEHSRGMATFALQLLANTLAEADHLLRGSLLQPLHIYNYWRGGQ